VLLKIILARILQLLLEEAIEESINALLKIPTVFLALDDDAKSLDSMYHDRVASHNIAELLLGTQSIENRLVEDLAHQEQLGAESTIAVTACEENVPDAVVNIIWVVERASIAEVATRPE